MDLLEEYGMEYIRWNDKTMYIWYKGTDLKADGLQQYSDGSFYHQVESIMKIMRDNPDWKLNKPQ
jgi:hypothetical protein